MRFEKRAAEDEPQLSLVPLIDVLLVVLIFLSLTTTFAQMSLVTLQLPHAEVRSPAASKQVVVALDGAGNVQVDNRLLGQIEAAALARVLAQLVPAREEAVVVIEADRHTPHQRVVDVLAAAQQAGLLRIGFAVERAHAVK